MTRYLLAFLFALLGIAAVSIPPLHAQDGRSLCRVGDTVEIYIDRGWWEGEVKDGPTPYETCGVTHKAFFGVPRTDYFTFDLVRAAGTDPSNTGPAPTSPLCIIGDEVSVRVASGWHLGTVIGKHPTDGSCTVRHEAYGTPLDHQVEPDDVGEPALALRQTAAAASPAPRQRDDVPQTPRQTAAATAPATREPAAAPQTPRQAAPDQAQARQVPRQAPTPAPPAASAPATLPDGRYVCSQGGLTSGGTMHWGYFDLSGRSYRPFTGSGGSYRYDGRGSVQFQGGIFERYEWVGIARRRADGIAEITLVERADLDAYRAGRSRGGGSGIAVVCGYDGTR